MIKIEYQITSSFYRKGLQIFTTAHFLLDINPNKYSSYYVNSSGFILSILLSRFLIVIHRPLYMVTARDAIIK